MSVRSYRAVAALICVLLCGASCSGGGSDPIVGTWNLNGGPVIKFTRNRVSCTAEGTEPIFGGAAGQKWESSWSRKDNVITIEAPAGSNAQARRFQILKLEARELAMRSLPDSALLTADKAD